MIAVSLTALGIQDCSPLANGKVVIQSLILIETENKKIPKISFEIKSIFSVIHKKLSKKYQLRPFSLQQKRPNKKFLIDLFLLTSLFYFLV